ncbi:MAG: excinuclease ABC subunit UvrA [Mediterranea sp.]|nr:excinuclease ABC subunit UvrA [Mediterranea sp.]
MRESKPINVYGAREHNLKNIDVEIPRHKLTVITGLSGSGKSSLAFDTIFAEGKRRYVETFSSYARKFLGDTERPDVDGITGLSPVIAIDQKSTNKNPRSTVGTITEIYDYLRLLYARAGEAYSYLTGEKMIRYTEQQIQDLLINNYTDKKIFILAPVVRSRKGHYKELFENIQKKGYLQVRVDGKIQEIKYGMKLDRYKNHDVEIVIDKMVVSQGFNERLMKSATEAMQQGEGMLMVLDADTMKVHYYSKQLMSPLSNLSYKDPAPHNFSFNSPQGACPKCKGLGMVSCIDIEKVIPNRELSIYDGGIAPLGKYKDAMIFRLIAFLLEKCGATLKTPIKELNDSIIQDILCGTGEEIVIKNFSSGSSSDYTIAYEGIMKIIKQMQEKESSADGHQWAEEFTRNIDCPECKGARLNREALSFRIHDKNIYELTAMDIVDLYKWLLHVDKHLSDKQNKIALEIIKEICIRLKFILHVGLGYLSLSRSSTTLSGGESQRIRLASQISSQLVNVLYILDEPSIGLHQRDNRLLIHSLEKLRDAGNTIIVVEHDKEIMLAADYVIDLGPKAGRLGGEVVFQGTPQQMLKTDTLTSQYLNGRKTIEVPAQRRAGNGKSLWLRGAKGNNLKNVDVEFPLGKLICVTGVSGSGKSSLVSGTLLPILSKKLHHSHQYPLAYDSIEGIEHIDKVVSVDQTPIGRNPRSNPATYTGVFTNIRNLFVELPESKVRGYDIGRFSFNLSHGGRCEACSGYGYKAIDMSILPDVYVPCKVCRGKRYNRETLEVRFKGKSIADVLDMTINHAVEFFENIPKILKNIKTMQDVGLGYIKLGQSSTTLSGGENQRVKLAAELSKRDTGKTVYILDEPTTGLHFEDIRVLMNVLNKLVNKGNTIIIIEHNLDVVKMADHVIDMGLEGGKKGGELLSFGTPEVVAASNKGYTSQFLKEELGL